MRVAREVVEARQRELAFLIQQRGFVPLAEVCQTFGISEPTARRDLATLAKEKKIKRTLGGALSDYNDRFPSFQQRLAIAAPAKKEIARRALAMIQPGQTCYFDAGTTIYLLAQQLAARPVPNLTVVTPTLPVADLLAGIPGIEIHLTGGQLLERQSVLLGSTVLLVLGRWRFDLAFLSVEGFTREGLWNTSPEVVAMQKMAARRARKTFILADASKQGHNAPAFLFPWKRVNGLLTETASKELIRWKVPTFP